MADGIAVRETDGEIVIDAQSLVVGYGLNVVVYVSRVSVRKLHPGLADDLPFSNSDMTVSRTGPSLRLC